MNSTVGILLAGGMSRRYGSPKAFAEVAGKPFYEHAYKALAGVCDEVVIVTRPELAARFSSEYDVITDLDCVAGQGPLAGILSGMTARPAEKYAILPCDMPFVGKAETAKLIAKADSSSDITAVRNGSEKIPLFSIWDHRIKAQLQLELQTGQYRVMKFMEKVDTEWIETSEIHENPLVFRNLNQPED